MHKTTTQNLPASVRKSAARARRARALLFPRAAALNTVEVYPLLSGYGPPLEPILTKKMANDARLLGRGAAASSYDEPIRESRAYAETLRRAITQT
jgi:hypothetical protein